MRHEADILGAREAEERAIARQINYMKCWKVMKCNGNKKTRGRKKGGQASGAEGGRVGARGSPRGDTGAEAKEEARWASGKRVPKEPRQLTETMRHNNQLLLSAGSLGMLVTQQEMSGEPN